MFSSRRRRERSGTRTGQESTSETDAVVTATITAPINDSLDRQVTPRQEEPFQIQLIENRIVEGFNENDGRKSAVAKGMRDSADFLDKQQRDMDIAKVSFASAGITASILAIIGLALAPVSAGASLGLTAAGIAMGVASGTGGLATEVADRIINSKALQKAQATIDDYNNQNKKLLQLMDVVREQRGIGGFRKFLEEKLKKVSPKVYEWFNKHLQNEVKQNSCDPEPAKTGARVAAAAGKIASEMFEAGGKAIKVGSLVFSVFTIPLDLHTLVSNSIKIHKRTPSETAEYIRKLADELEFGGQLDEREELKQRAEKLEREVKRQKQQWMNSMEDIGEDVFRKMEETAILYDYNKKEVLRIQTISLLTHMVVRPLALILLPCFLTSDPESWLYMGACVSLVYDGVYLILNIAMEVYSYWIVYHSNKEIEKGLYAARNVFKNAPQTVMSSVEEMSRSFHSSSALKLKNCSRYYNFFETTTVALKTLLDFIILWRFGYLNDSIEDIVQPTSPSLLPYLFSPFPLSEPMIRLDLIIFWLAICAYLLTSAMKQHMENAQSLLAADVINLGEDFRRRLKKMMCDGRETNHVPLLQNRLDYVDRN